MKQKVTKFIAAEEQLVTAINLYFENGSQIAVHSLVRNAHEILDALCASRNLKRGILHEGVDLIRPDKRKEFFKKISEARNFFKHAKDDPEKDIEWNPDASLPYMWDACSIHQRLSGVKKPCEIISFMLWYRINNPELWEGVPKTNFDDHIGEVALLLSDQDKSESYKLLLETCRAFPSSHKPLI